MDFNQKRPFTLHLDLNSCFATIEQQANPNLRGRPIAVAAYTTASGCILAPSIEAKAFGVKTGMRVKEGRSLCPALHVLSPDPEKYRAVHLSLRKIMTDYTNDFSPKSIDEFVLNLEGYPVLKRLSVREVAAEIKRRVKAEVGDWLMISAGIGPNRFLAKTASSLKKPDGLETIDKTNFLAVYRKLTLTDLHGINLRNEARLKRVGVQSVIDFYHAPREVLRAAFESVLADYWYLRLRGFEVDGADFKRKSFGNSYALPRPLNDSKSLSPIIATLVEKTAARLREKGYKAFGVHLALVFRNGNWGKAVTLRRAIFDSRDLFKEVMGLLRLCPDLKPVAIVAESCFDLVRGEMSQLELFDDILKKESLASAVDKINGRWGAAKIGSARKLYLIDAIHDRISFGGVKDL